MARPRCLYCGKALTAEAVAAAVRSAQALVRPEPAPRPSRVLVLLDVSGAEPAELASQLGLSLYEARQRVARGGVQLHRALEPEAAAEAAGRLRGLRVHLVPEQELEPALDPVRLRGGSLEGGALELRSVEGPLRLAPEDVLGLVRGPIAREYAAQDAGRRKTLGTAGLEPGYRFQVHRSNGPPVEFDPWAFEFGRREPGRSSLLTLTGWLSSLAAGRPQDDGFRLEPPALSPSEELAEDARRALGWSERPRGAAPILDNLRQFRFYSGWRAALLRRGV